MIQTTLGTVCTYILISTVSVEAVSVSPARCPLRALLQPFSTSAAAVATVSQPPSPAPQWIPPFVLQQPSVPPSPSPSPLLPGGRDPPPPPLSQPLSNNRRLLLLAYVGNDRSGGRRRALPKVSSLSCRASFPQKALRPARGSRGSRSGGDGGRRGSGGSSGGGGGGCRGSGGGSGRGDGGRRGSGDIAAAIAMGAAAATAARGAAGAPQTVTRSQAALPPAAPVAPWPTAPQPEAVTAWDGGGRG